MPNSGRSAGDRGDQCSGVLDLRDSETVLLGWLLPSFGYLG